MISIVVPTYNEEGYIEGTLKRLKVLDRKNFEVIVSDSRSTDRTVALARPLADKVVQIKEGKKRSIPQGRNDGAAAARGDYVVFMDADVHMADPNDFFVKALARFKKNPKLVAVTARIKVQPELARWSDKMIYGFVNPYFAIANNVFHFGMSGGEFQMIKMSAFRTTGGFNEKLSGGGEDMDLFRRLSQIGRTRLPWELTVLHTGRRLHQSGWLITIYRWIRNAFSVWFFKKSADEEWEAVR